MADGTGAKRRTLLWVLAITFAPVAARALSTGTPWVFEPNQGQAAAEVKFLYRGPDLIAMLTATGIVLAVPDRDKSVASIVQIRFVGARWDCPMEGLDPMPGFSNYFVGADASRWRTRIPQYARVRCRGIFPGVDLLLHETNGALEYDFVVARTVRMPRAFARHPPSAVVIRLAFDGVDKIDLSGGDLVLRLGETELLRQLRPKAFQGTGVTTRAVPVRYALLGSKEVEIRATLPDAAQPLTIDPMIVYSTYLGGTGTDTMGAIDDRQPGLPAAVDSDGNLYLVGETTSVDFPVSPGAVQGQLRGPSDAFIAKLDPSGRSLIYATFLGGTGSDRASAVAADGLGRAYVAGRTSSLNFPVVQPAIGSFRGGDYDAWAAHLSADGSQLLYSTYLGGSSNDSAFGVALDSAPHMYVTGGTKSEDFPTTAGVFSEVLSGNTDAFVLELDPSQGGAASLLFSTYLGGSAVDRGNAIAIGATGNIYVVGRTNSGNFPRHNAFQQTYGGGTDAFFSVLSGDGRTLLYSTYLGGSAFDLANALAVDADNRAYIVGETASANFPIQNAFQPNLGGGAGSDAFIAILDPSLSGPDSLKSSSFLGGSGLDRGTAVAVDSETYAVWMAGETGSNQDFPVSVDAFQPQFGGGMNDGFVAKVDPTGPTGLSLVFSSFLGGSASESVASLVLDFGGFVWVMGDTHSSDFPVTDDAYQLSNRGTVNVFATRVGPR